MTTDRIIRDLSLGRRVGLTVAGLAGLLGAGLLGLLWATEPSPLPARTGAAFAALIAVGLTWAGVAAWALARRPLFALDRIVAASLAVTFSTVSTVWAVVLASSRGGADSALTAAGIGAALIVVSTVLLVRARAYRKTLLDRRRRLRGEDDERPDPPRVPLPIGPLAIALRLRAKARANDSAHTNDSANTSGRVVTVVAVIVAAALLAGLALLLV